MASERNTVEWQMKRFGLSREEAEKKLEDNKKKMLECRRMKYDIDWQMQHFGLTREEAEDKVKRMRENNSKSNYAKLDPEWQMKRFGLSREEAEEKIRRLRASYGSARPKSVEWQMQHFGLTREEAEDKVKRILESTAKNVSKNRLEHPEKNQSRKEYWIEKGFSEVKALEKVNAHMQKMRDSYKSILEKEPDKYKDRANTSIEYYLAKGLSIEDAEKALKDRQNTFTLEKCIKKYGEEAGIKKYRERQERWSKKMQEKYNNGEYSKQPLNHNSSCYSSIEKKFIDLLESNFSDLENLKTYKTIQQSFRKDNGKMYFSDVCYKNKIVEFNGDYWHCNPSIYDETYYHKIKKQSAKEIWDYDNEKINFIKSKGFDVYVVWEKDFVTDPGTVITNVIQFLNS